MKRQDFKSLLLLLLLAVIWGPSFLFIKIAIQEIGPLTLAMLRVGFAAILLNAYLLAKGGKYGIPYARLKHILVVGFFSQAFPFTLINWGEQYIDSGLAAMLNGITPISAIVLAHFALADDKMSVERIIGVSFGLLGLFILVLPELSFGLGGTVFGTVAVVAAAFSYGIGAVYAGVHLKGLSVQHSTGLQLLFAAVYLLPASLYVEGPVALREISWTAMGAVLALASVGTALGFVLFYHILSRNGPSFASFVTYIVPFFAVILGITFLKESVSYGVIFGGVLIVSGAMVINKNIPVRAVAAKCKSIVSSAGRRKNLTTEN